MPTATQLYNLYLIDAPQEFHTGLDALIHKVFPSKHSALSYALDYIAGRLPQMDLDPGEPEILELAFGDMIAEKQQLVLAQAMQKDSNVLLNYLLTLPLNDQYEAIDRAFRFFCDDDMVAECVIEPLEIAPETDTSRR